jgi:hypothetical protein
MNSQKISWIRWKHVYFEYVFHGKVTPDVNCIVTPGDKMCKTNTDGKIRLKLT